MKYENEAKQLKRSHWPACDALAEDLASRGSEAADALAAATTSRIHHVRSAALRALAKVDTPRARSVAQSMLADRAYEVRETAQSVLDEIG